MEIVQPPEWPSPRGYANGIRARGSLLFVAGQIGWNEREELVAGDFVAQVEQALRNVCRVLEEGGARPEHITRMTWYVTDREAYLDAAKAVGQAYRRVMGKHFPTMSLVIVAGLLEKDALVEIEATAVIPDPERA